MFQRNGLEAIVEHMTKSPTGGKLHFLRETGDCMCARTIRRAVKKPAAKGKKVKGKKGKKARKGGRRGKQEE